MRKKRKKDEKEAPFLYGQQQKCNQKHHRDQGHEKQRPWHGSASWVTCLFLSPKLCLPTSLIEVILVLLSCCCSLLQGFCSVTICYVWLRLWHQNRRMKKAQFQLILALVSTMMHCWFEWSYYWWGDTTLKDTRNLTPPLFSPISCLLLLLFLSNKTQPMSIKKYVLQLFILLWIRVENT